MKLPSLLLVLTLAGATSVVAHHLGAPPRVDHAWIRETLPGQSMTVAYLTLSSDDHEDDALLGVACDAATKTEMHDMSVANGRMSMRPVSEIALPAHGKAVLAPGGLHLMLLDLKRPLRRGEHVRLRLRFRFAGEVDVDVPVLSLDEERDARP